MRISVKTKIWITVLSVVLMFAGFTLFYFPALQERYLLKNYNSEVQNLSNTVALGVKIALTEQNFEGVQTAMDFVKDDRRLRFVSLVQLDTVWNEAHQSYSIEKSVFKTYPSKAKINLNTPVNDSMIVKSSAFSTPMMHGEILLGFSTAEIIQNKKQIRFTSLLVSTIVFVIGFILGFWLAKNISQAVLELRDAANKVGEGDLTQRVVYKSNDEIGELGLAFNKMVGDLSKAQKQVEDRTNELMAEKRKSDELLEDLKKTLADLKETQEQLIRQEKLASVGQLTKGIVDRILNPLNYINNFSILSCDLISEMTQLIKEHKEAMGETAYQEISDLLEMADTNMKKINDHGTSASRIVKGMEKLLKEKPSIFLDTDINKLIETNVQVSVQEMKKTYRNFEVHLTSDLQFHDTPVKVIPSELGSVIVHMISNSYFSLFEKARNVKDFIPEIRISTAFQDKYFTIKVWDNGKGIARKELSQLFSPFFTTKPTAIGTGLGLYMSQDIIKTHKGSINVDTKEGLYTEFQIMIPLSESKAPKQIIV